MLLFRHAVYWLRRFLFASWTVPLSWRDPTWLLLWLLLSYFALNFLNVVRPFPIGWDDLGSYLNRPRLLISYGHFIRSMYSFQWEYLTSLGFLLFGYDSTFGTIASLMVNWMAGILAVLAIFTFLRVFLGGGGLLAALLYYTLPLVGHFSFADMKVDNAVFAMGAYSVLALFLGLFPPSDALEERHRVRWTIVSGVFAGFAFGMKSTAVMGIFALFPVFLGATVRWWASFPALLFVWGLYAWRNVFDFSSIFLRAGWGVPPLSNRALAFLLWGCCVVLLLPSIRTRWRSWCTLLGRVGVFGVAAAVVVAPWMWQETVLSSARALMGAEPPRVLVPILDIKGQRSASPGETVYSLPPELVVNTADHACSQPTGSKEELDRYWGFQKGWRHYLTLPWRAVMNLDSAGYYVTTMPGLLLFPLLLLLPFFWRKENRWVRWLFAGTLFMLLQWTFLARGIPWYGIGTFLGLVIGLEVLFIKAPDPPSRSVMSVLLCFWLLIVFNNRFWQYDMQKNLFEYPMGKVSYETLRERTIPHYDDIADIVLDRYEKVSDRPYLYRVGTFIPYFIPRNLEIIGAADHQLDLFNCIYQERDPKLTTARLK